MNRIGRKKGKGDSAFPQVILIPRLKNQNGCPLLCAAEGLTHQGPTDRALCSPFVLSRFSVFVILLCKTIEAHPVMLLECRLSPRFPRKSSIAAVFLIRH